MMLQGRTPIHHLLTPLRAFPSCACALIAQLSPPSSAPILLSPLWRDEDYCRCGTATTPPAVPVPCTPPALPSREELGSVVSKHGSGPHSQPCAQNSGVYFREYLSRIQRRKTRECCNSTSGSTAALCIFRSSCISGVFCRSFVEASRPPVARLAEITPADVVKLEAAVVEQRRAGERRGEGGGGEGHTYGWRDIHLR